MADTASLHSVANISCEMAVSLPAALQDLKWFSMTAITASSSSCNEVVRLLLRCRGEVAAAKARYVFGPEQLSRLNRLLSQYEGTHNFHNFTVSRRGCSGVVGNMARLMS
jgi:tRNA U38,U39,U40 pseudouridine synthase TruA